MATNHTNKRDRERGTEQNEGEDQSGIDRQQKTYGERQKQRSVTSITHYSLLPRSRLDRKKYSAIFIFTSDFFSCIEYVQN